MIKYIYKITNLINGKIYIGQTVDYIRRFREHKIQPEDDKILYKAFKKYGLSNFKFEIIEQTENYNEREKFWISFYNSMVPNGYNATPGGEEPPVFHGENHHLAEHTQKEVDEIKKLLKSNDLTTEEIAQKFNYSPSSVLRINKGDLWFDSKESYPLRPEITKDFEKERALQIINDLLNSEMTQKQIAEKYNMGRSAITAINIGQNHKQENLEYPLRQLKNSPRPVYMLDPETEQVLQEFASVKIAAISLEKPNGESNIRSCISGRSKTAYGYKWCYAKK